MSFAFIDSHAHFWDPRRLTYPWLAEAPSIATVHTPLELRADVGDNLPEKIVFVQAECDRRRWLDEVEWVETLVVAEPRIGGIVAHAPMNAGATTTKVIAQLQDRPLMRGVRHLIQGEADPEFCTRDIYVAGVRRLGEAGLTFDICCRHPQLPAVIELVRRCPGTTFILDHGGKPGIHARLMDPWRGQIETLATLPNVECKLSGLVTEADPVGWRIEDLRPFAAHLLAHFGPSRLLFGSDWPVVKLAGGYARWLAAARQLVSHLSGAEQRAIFSDNARRIYRLA